MKTTTRRDLLRGLACGSLIIGFDPLNRSWVTSANAAGAAKLEHLPHLDGVLRTDEEALTAASGDFGLFVNRRPVAVLEAGSVQDIARVVRFANKHDLRIAVRGNGHSVYGQTLVKGGIVIQMSMLSKARNLPGARVRADAGCSWGAVLEETLKEGATPPVIPDYLGLSVGGTLSIGGISPTALLRFAQDAAEGERMLAGNRQLFEESRALGGTLYPFSAVKLSRSDWRQHYGHNFDELARAKHRYDSKNVLASGPDLFQDKNVAKT